MDLGLEALGVAPFAIVDDSGIAGAATLYLGEEEYCSFAADADPHRRYVGCVAQPLLLRRSGVGRDLIAGPAPIAGELEAINLEGVLDAALRSGGFAGHRVVIKAVRRGDRLDNARIFAVGRVLEETFDERRVRIRFGPRRDLAATPLQSAVYAGTGAAEGGDDLKGKRKPVVLGRVYDAPLTYLGLVNGLATFHAGAHRMNAITAVREKGVAYAFTSETPSASQWTCDLATGVVTVGGTPSDLTAFTFDGEGWVRGDGSWPSTTAALIAAVLEDFTQVPNVEIDFSALAVLEADRPGVVGLYVGPEERSAQQVLSALLEGVAAVGDFDRLGRYVAFALKAPGGAVRARFDHSNILRLEHVRGPAGMEPPPWRILVGWRRCWTPTTDVLPGATDAQRAFMASEFREAAWGDGRVQDRFPTSGTLTVRSTLQDQADAEALAATLGAIYAANPRPRLRRVLTRNAAPELDLGQTVEITDPDFGLDRRLGVIVGVAVDLERAETELEVFC